MAPVNPQTPLSEQELQALASAAFACGRHQYFRLLCAGPRTRGDDSRVPAEKGEGAPDADRKELMPECLIP